MAVAAEQSLLVQQLQAGFNIRSSLPEVVHIDDLSDPLFTALDRGT